MIIIIIIIITLDKATLIQTRSVRHEYNHDDEMPCTAAKTSYENHQQILLWCSHNTDEILTQYLRIFVSLLLNDMYQTEIGKTMFQYKTGLLPDIRI